MAAAVSMTLLVAGTFLPWLRSGTVARNLYQTVAVWQRWLATDDFHADVVLPYVAAVLAVIAAVAALGWYRTAAVLALITAVSVVILAATVTVSIERRGRMGVTLDILGPVVVMAGAIGLAVCAGHVLRTSSRGNRHKALSPQDMP